MFYDDYIIYLLYLFICLQLFMKNFYNIDNISYFNFLCFLIYFFLQGSSGPGASNTGIGLSATMPTFKSLTEETEMMLRRQRQKGADYKFREGPGMYNTFITCTCKNCFILRYIWSLILNLIIYFYSFFIIYCNLF